MTIQTVHMVRRDPHAACLDFLAAFFHWALADAESDPGNRLTSGVTDPIGLTALWAIEQFAKAEQPVLRRALVKQTFAEEPQREHLRFEPEEERLGDACKALLLKRSPVENTLHAQELSGNNRARPNRRVLARLLKRKLVGVAGAIESRSRASVVWYHQQEVNGWSVETEIDIGGAKDRIVQYSHEIRSQVDQRPLAQGISVLRWRGLSPRTQWTYTLGRDEEAISDDVAKIVDHWMRAVPSLVSGLKP